MKDCCSNCDIFFQFGKSSSRCSEAYHTHCIISQKTNHAQCPRLRLRKYKLVRSYCLCSLGETYFEGYVSGRLAYHLFLYKRSLPPQVVLLLQEKFCITTYNQQCKGALQNSVIKPLENQPFYSDVKKWPNIIKNFAMLIPQDF